MKMRHKILRGALGLIAGISLLALNDVSAKAYTDGASDVSGLYRNERWLYYTYRVDGLNPNGGTTPGVYFNLANNANTCAFFTGTQGNGTDGGSTPMLVQVGNYGAQFNTINRAYTGGTAAASWGGLAFLNHSEAYGIENPGYAHMSLTNYVVGGGDAYINRKLQMYIGVLPVSNYFPTNYQRTAFKDYSNNLYFHFVGNGANITEMVTDNLTSTYKGNFSLINDEVIGQPDNKFDGILLSMDVKRILFVSTSPNVCNDWTAQSISESLNLNSSPNGYVNNKKNIIDFERNSSYYYFSTPNYVGTYYNNIIFGFNSFKGISKKWGETTSIASIEADRAKLASSKTVVLVYDNNPMSGTYGSYKTQIISKPYQIVRYEYQPLSGAEGWQGYTAWSGGAGTRLDVDAVGYQMRPRTPGANKDSASNLTTGSYPALGNLTGGGSGGTANVPTAHIMAKVSLGKVSLPDASVSKTGYNHADWSLTQTDTTASDVYTAPSGRVCNYYLNPASYTSTKNTLVSNDLLTYKFLPENTSTYTETNEVAEKVSILNIESINTVTPAFQDPYLYHGVWGAGYYGYESALKATYTPKTYYIEYNKNYGSVYNKANGTWSSGTYASLNKFGLNSANLIYGFDNPAGNDQTVTYDTVVKDSSWSTASTVGNRYEFKGWWVDTVYSNGSTCDYNMPLTLFLTGVAGGGKVNKDIPNNAVIHVYPRWEPKAVLFKFKPYAGSVYMGDTSSWFSSATSILGYNKLSNNPLAVADEEHMIGDVIASLPNTTCKGYEFKGWYTDFGCTTSWVSLLDGDSKLKDPSASVITLYAKWEPKKYTITYNGNLNWNGSSIVAKGNGATNEQYKSKVYWYNEKVTLDDAFKRDATNKTSQPANQVLHYDANTLDGIDDWQLLGYSVGTNKSVQTVADTPTNEFMSGGTKLTPANEVYGLSETDVTLTSVWRRQVAVLWDLQNGTSYYSTVYMYNNNSQIAVNVPYGVVKADGTNQTFADGTKKFLGWACEMSTTSSKAVGSANATVPANKDVIGRRISTALENSNKVINTPSRISNFGAVMKKQGNSYSLNATLFNGTSGIANTITLGGLPDKNLDAYGNITNNNGFTKDLSIAIANSTTCWAQWESATEATLSVTVQNDARKALTYYLAVDSNDNPLVTKTYGGSLTATSGVNSVIKYAAGGNSIISKLNCLNAGTEEQFVSYRMNSGIGATDLGARVIQTYAESGHGDDLNGTINVGLPDLILGGGEQGTKTVGAYGFNRTTVAKNWAFGAGQPSSYSIRYKSFIPVYLHYNKNPNATDGGFFTDCARGNSGAYIINYSVSRVSFYRTLHMVGGTYKLITHNVPVGIEINASELSSNPGNGEDDGNPIGGDTSAPDGTGGGIKSTLELQ